MLASLVSCFIVQMKYSNTYLSFYGGRNGMAKNINSHNLEMHIECFGGWIIKGPFETGLAVPVGFKQIYKSKLYNCIAYPILL